MEGWSSGLWHQLGKLTGGISCPMGSNPIPSAIYRSVMLIRYDMIRDWGYYESDTPEIVPESCKDGEWVRFSDVVELFTKHELDIKLLGISKAHNHRKKS